MNGMLKFNSRQRIFQKRKFYGLNKRYINSNKNKNNHLYNFKYNNNKYKNSINIKDNKNKFKNNFLKRRKEINGLTFNRINNNRILNNRIGTNRISEKRKNLISVGTNKINNRFTNTLFNSTQNKIFLPKSKGKSSVVKTDTLTLNKNNNRFKINNNNMKYKYKYKYKNKIKAGVKRNSWNKKNFFKIKKRKYKDKFTKANFFQNENKVINNKSKNITNKQDRRLLADLLDDKIYTVTSLNDQAFKTTIQKQDPKDIDLNKENLKSKQSKTINRQDFLNISIC
jgi:hypothetical protein